MASTLVISVPSTRILDDHAEYGIACAVYTVPTAAAGEGTVLVWRRYRDFDQLRKELMRASPSLLVPNLPAKHSWWTSRSAQVVNERQRQLEQFLKEIEAGLERPGSAWSIFCHFVGVSPSVFVAQMPVAMARRESEDSSNSLRDEVLRLQNQISMLEDEDAKLKLDLAQREQELSNLRNKRLDSKQMKEQANLLEKEKNHLVVEVARLEALLNSAGDAQHELNILKEDNARLKSEFSLLESDKTTLQATLARHDELVDSLRREIARLEDEAKRMQAEINTLQQNLQNNANEETLRSEVNKLKKEKGVLELEIARLETAQQSAAAYGAGVLAKLEKSEKEKSQAMNEAKVTIETESRMAAAHRQRIEELEHELKVAQATLDDLNKEIQNANNRTEEVMAANELLKASMEGEESELATLRREVNTLQDQLAKISAEYELLKARSNAGNGEIEGQLELLNKQVIEYKTESEKNINIKMKLATRVDTLVAENLHLKEKNLSLERRLKLLQGD